ncbi:ABC1 kinase family protein [Longispora albida]|uniref:ABC1 kinase family protein n=1 Tax=Longispora albida TaxID=203523 RepID=UPI00038041DA|nr:AarF/UbiB family protein [Longispora albida]
MDVLIFLIAVVSFAVLVWGMAVAARRLLGVRFGFARLVVAGMTGLTVAEPLARSLTVGTPQDGWFILLATLCAQLVTVAFLVVTEVLLPSGSVTPIRWLRSWRSSMARTRRYLQISRILIRRGLGPYLRGRRRLDAASRARLAASIRQALEEGGVTFVKLGQVLSTRRDLLPAEFIDELSALRDQAAPIPWPEIAGRLEAEFGVPLGELFAEIDEQPLAAASVAQVHTARLLSGAEVVVKVQRPGIHAVVERDLDIVRRLARTLETRTSWGRSTGALSLAEGFAQAVREELDFRIEARNMTAVAAASADPGVVYPVPCEGLCTSRVLVMNRLHGVPMSKAGPVAAARGADPSALASILLRCILRQVMLGGVFHADPHPGNVLLLPDGRLGLLDFGSVGRIDSALRSALQRLLLAIDRADPTALTDALLDLVPRPENADPARLERSLGQFMARHLAAGMTPEAQMFTDLFRIVAEYGLAIPPEIAAVFRALGTLEGGLADLAPGFDMIGAARGFATTYLAEQATPEAIRGTLTEELVTVLPIIRRLPRRLDRIAGALEQGRLSVSVRLLADERDRQHITGLLHQVLLTILGATAGVMAVLLLGTDGGPQVTPKVSLYELLGYHLLVVSVFLVLRVLIRIFRSNS